MVLLIAPLSPGRAQEAAGAGSVARSTATPTSILLRFRQIEQTRQPDGTTRDADFGMKPVLSALDQAALPPRPITPNFIGVSSKGPNPGEYSEHTVEATAGVNGDKTITLHIVWRDNSLQKPTGGLDTRATHECAFTRRVAPGQPVRVILFQAANTTDYLEVVAEPMPDHAPGATP